MDKKLLAHLPKARER